MSNRMLFETGDEDSKNVSKEKEISFDELVSSLPGLTDEIRPRRWISRLGRLLRASRDHNDYGQSLISKKAGVTQPYLSRLENGLLPKRGPTVEVLLRCIEAADCDIEIAIRSKKDGVVVGRLDSADLDRAEWTLKQPVHSHDQVSHDKINVQFKPGHRKSTGVVWVSTLDALGRHSIMSRHTANLFKRVIGNIFQNTKAGPLTVKAIDPSMVDSNTVNIQVGDLLVLGSESELTRALGDVEISD